MPKKVGRKELAKMMESAGFPAEIDWSKIDIQRILTFILYILEFWRNPPVALKGAADHDPALACLCRAACLNMEAVEEICHYLEEHHPELQEESAEGQ